MTSRFEKVSTVVMALAALAVAVKYTATSQVNPRTPLSAPPVLSKEENWRLADGVALSATPRNGQVEVIEFIDLECPFCADFSHTMDSLSEILSDTVRVSYVNLPINGHRFAKSGAIAVECAFRQGRGEQFIASAYANQDSIGFWNWAAFAKRAGVADSADFHTCTQDPAVGARVDSSRAVARMLAVPGTPSIFVGGWRYDKPPTLAQLVKDVRTIATKRRGQ